MRRTRSFTIAFAVVLACLAGCGESGGGMGASATSSAPSAPSEPAALAVAMTDADVYMAAEVGIAVFESQAAEPLFLPGCAPFVFEQSLDGEWAFVGPPFVCVWEGVAFRVEPKAIDEIEFVAPSETGIYRLRYDFSSGCEADRPLSQANCESEFAVYSNGFEVGG